MFGNRPSATRQIRFPTARKHGEQSIGTAGLIALSVLSVAGLTAIVLGLISVLGDDVKDITSNNVGYYDATGSSCIPIRGNPIASVLAGTTTPGTPDNLSDGLSNGLGDRSWVSAQLNRTITETETGLDFNRNGEIDPHSFGHIVHTSTLSYPPAGVSWSKISETPEQSGVLYVDISGFYSPIRDTPDSVPRPTPTTVRASLFNGLRIHEGADFNRQRCWVLLEA